MGLLGSRLGLNNLLTFFNGYCKGIVSARKLEVFISVFQVWAIFSLQGDDIHSVNLADGPRESEKLQRLFQGDILYELPFSEGSIDPVFSLAFLDIGPPLPILCHNRFSGSGVFPDFPVHPCVIFAGEDFTDPLVEGGVKLGNS